MVEVNAENLPWYLIGVLVTLILSFVTALLRGAILPRRVAEQLRESAEKRAEMAEAGTTANTKTNESLVASVTQLIVLAENQDKVLKALRDRAERDHTRSKGGGST